MQEIVISSTEVGLSMKICKQSLNLWRCFVPAVTRGRGVTRVADEFKMSLIWVLEHVTLSWKLILFSDSDNIIWRRCGVCAILVPYTNVTTYLLTLFLKSDSTYKRKRKKTTYVQ